MPRRPAARSDSPVLRLGFVALTDAAPLWVAEALGLFDRLGLRVRLSRETGWATIRAKLAFGELDAANAPAGLAVALAEGWESAPCGCRAPLVLSWQGNAITLASALLSPGDGLRALPDIAHTRRREGRPLVFGVVSPHSSHAALLRRWLRGNGLDLARDIVIVVVPPPQMFRNLVAGNIDGYCAGEPWNTLAVQSGHGWCPATSAELAPGHPEKILLASERFQRTHPAEYAALIAALVDACAWCDDPGKRAEVVRLLAAGSRLDIPRRPLAPALIGPFATGDGRKPPAAPFIAFHRASGNRPSCDDIAWIMEALAENDEQDRPMPALGRVAEIFDGA